MATLENIPTTEPERNDRSFSRRIPIIASALTGTLVATALIATLSLAAPGRNPPLSETPSETLTGRTTDAAASAPLEISATTERKAPVISTVGTRTLQFSPERVAKVAKRYTGSRYRFGGTSPAGFDCSGFTKYIYSKFGIDLPHSAAAQGRLGNRVSRAKAKAGDIVVTSGGSHVGIYVGKGKFIDAPAPGRAVHIRKIYTSNYYLVRMHEPKKQHPKKHDTQKA